jgi:general secretion pathway protein C
LSGVVVAQNTSSSVAVLKNVKTGKTFIKTVGDRIFDMELTHVFEDGIILKKGEKIYWLLLDKGFQFKTDKETPQNSKGDERVELDNNLPNREFVRSEVQKRAEQERTLIIKETRVVPNYVDGKIDGFKVIGLPKDGIVTEVGIHKDDVIKEVNGVKLSNLTALVMLYSKFSEEERYEVLIERDKKLIRQVYILK